VLPPPGVDKPEVAGQQPNANPGGR
jgi:hypothetical protein